MKTLKKALAVILAVVFVLSMAACHPKDEVAVSAGEYTVTSAMYSYFLTMADAEAKSLISSSEDYDTSASNFSYYKQEIEDKPYETYVKDLALANCLRYIALEKLCDEAELSIDEEDKEGWESTAEYYWNYSYGPILLENGVGFETYKKIFMNDALYSVYFESLYAEGGEKEVSADSIKAALGENYAAVYMITHDYSDIEEPDVDAIAKTLDKYVKALNDGEEFADVLADYKKDNEEDSSTTSSSTTSSASSDNSSSASSDTSSDSSSTTSSETSSEETEEEKKPQDSNITILTEYEATYTGEATLFDKYADVEKLAADEVALIHDEDAKSYYIVVKQDIYADEYYLDALSDEILYLLKAEEYDEFLKATAEELDYDVNKYAINQFKVKKIYDGTES